MPNIYLIGFMGSGKSNIGRLLAKKISWPFVDTDELIIEKERKSIPEIFSIDGESYFRKVESEVIKEVSSYKKSVIALGGGAIVNPENRKHIFNSGKTFYLNWPIEVLLTRIKKDTNRPLVKKVAQSDAELQLKILFKKREPLYNLANHIIDCFEGTSRDQVVNQISTLIER